MTKPLGPGLEALTGEAAVALEGGVRVAVMEFRLRDVVDYVCSAKVGGNPGDGFSSRLQRRMLDSMGNFSGPWEEQELCFDRAAVHALEGSLGPKAPQTAPRFNVYGGIWRFFGPTEAMKDVGAYYLYRYETRSTRPAVPFFPSLALGFQRIHKLTDTTIAVKSFLVLDQLAVKVVFEPKDGYPGVMISY